MPKTIKTNADVEAVDIATMAEMPMDEYEGYVRSGLLFVDHHGVLRSTPAGYPLAVTKAQAQALIRYLQEIASDIGSGREE